MFVQLTIHIVKKIKLTHDIIYDLRTIGKIKLLT